MAIATMRDEQLLSNPNRGGSLETSSINLANVDSSNTFVPKSSFRDDRDATITVR